MESYFLYIITAILLLISWKKDKKKTKMALKKAWKSFEKILPQFLVVILLIGFILSIINPNTISNFIGSSSGFFGTSLAAILGSITLIPGFVAFPTAALLLDKGAGYVQIAVFISTLMMVGIITLPVEIKYFKLKTTLYRNIFAFIFSFIIAYIIGKVMTL